MDALRSPVLQVLSSTSFGSSTPPSTSGHGGHLVRFSSSRSAAFGGCARKQLNTSALRTKRGEGRGACSCVVAATSADESVGTSSSGTLYSVLGVEVGGSLSEIKSAYKQMARRYHPDVCPINERDVCTQKFLEVRHAYDILSDPEKKAEYDYALMHPSFAQALQNSSTGSAWGRSRRTQGSEGVSDAWRFQWEAQLSRLRHSEAKKSATNSNSWGARMRREKNEQ